MNGYTWPDANGRLAPDTLNTNRALNTNPTPNATTPGTTMASETQTSSANSSSSSAADVATRPGVPASSRRGVRSAAAIAGLVALAHFTNDAYSAFLLPLLPRVMDRLGLSIALAATLAMTLSISASLIQPAMGYVADRFGRRPLVILGPLLSAVFMSSIGVAPTFAVLMGLLVLGGIGSAMFHPPAASMAARVSEGGRSGMRYSIFSFGGASGYAVGPMAAVAVVGLVGMQHMWLAMIPGLLVVVALVALLPPGVRASGAAPPPAPGVVLRALRGPLGLIFGISALQALVQRAYLTMEPIIMAQAGATEVVIAHALSAYLAGQAVGTLSGGFLADRFDRRRMLVALTLLMFPTHVAALTLPAGSVLDLVAAFVAGTVGMAMLPGIVVLAQEILPAGAAIGSGIVMGMAWAAGSIGVLGTGVLGDYVGPAWAALATMPFILIGTVLALGRGLRSHARPAGARA
ncbi:MAG: MFS transporter [Gemmatimonadota bacterium]